MGGSTSPGPEAGEGPCQSLEGPRCGKRAPPQAVRPRPSHVCRREAISCGGEVTVPLGDSVISPQAQGNDQSSEPWDLLSSAPF